MRKLVITLALIALLSACKQQQQPETVPAVPKDFGTLTLTTVPDPPLTGKETIFRLHATNPDGKPVTGASEQASLVMPMMDMGKNEVTLADKGNGDYEGKGKFTMSGPWNVVVNVSAGGRARQHTFPVAVRGD